MGRIKTILGDNIRTLRTNKGWTQVYLADRLQITAPFLAQMANYAEAKSHIRNVELKCLEKQLMEMVSEDIAKIFEKLREK